MKSETKVYMTQNIDHRKTTEAERSEWGISNHISKQTRIQKDT